MYFNAILLSFLFSVFFIPTLFVSQLIFLKRICNFFSFFFFFFLIFLWGKIKYYTEVIFRYRLSLTVIFFFFTFFKFLLFLNDNYYSVIGCTSFYNISLFMFFISFFFYKYKYPFLISVEHFFPFIIHLLLAALIKDALLPDNSYCTFCLLRLN